jgi:hypothetical protein
MSQFETFANPFTVTTPESMSAENMLSLFVDVFTDFSRVRDPGHTFLHGPRGSGKSMMFRYLKPDCQCLKNSCEIRKLNFFALYLPIKSTYLHLAELQRIEGRHADTVLNEHFMTIHFAALILSSLSETVFTSLTEADLEACKSLIDNVFYPLLTSCGWRGSKLSTKDPKTVSECFKTMQSVCDEIYSDIKNYFRKLSFHNDIIPYDKSLCGYLDFLFPLLKEIRMMPFMPDGPIYLLFDDADLLPEIQTRILNSWVSTRYPLEVSLKISTQHQYKTFRTVTGAAIDTPHDYTEVNISTVYTSSIKGKYLDRIREITKKRLDMINIDPDPYKFFPEDDEQEKKIKIFADAIKEKWRQGEGRGYRESDDVTRYARPDFIKSLAGQSKSSPTYSYAGFNQLVHLSSGIIRFFLDGASQMYNDTKAKSSGQPVKFIPHRIQSDVMKESAVKFLFDELQKISKDSLTHKSDQAAIQKLSNLINALGGLFRAILLSDRAERRVFSIAFSDTPSEDVKKIFDLGVRYGYFQESTIGRKDSLTGGRTRLYIMNRRLAPLFTLDPTSFAGYLFVTNEYIESLINQPERMLRRLQKGIDDQIEPAQLPLFEE